MPIGPENFVEPGNANRGQPTLFSPGYGKNVFSTVISPATGGAWVLGAARAVVTSGSPRCDSREIDCVPEDIKSLLMRLDALSRAQAQVVKTAASEVARASRSSRNRAQAKKYAQQAHDLYLQQWTTLWNGFPSTILVCSKGCAAVSDEATIRVLQDGSKESLGYANKTIALVPAGRSSQVKRQVARLKADAVGTFRLFETKSKELPVVRSVCDVQ